MRATYKRVKNWFLAKIENILLRRLAANSCVNGKTTIEKTTEVLASRVLNLLHSVVRCLWWFVVVICDMVLRSIRSSFHFVLFCVMACACCCCWWCCCYVLYFGAIRSVTEIATVQVYINTIAVWCYRSAWAGLSMCLPQAKSVPRSSSCWTKPLVSTKIWIERFSPCHRIAAIS